MEAELTPRTECPRSSFRCQLQLQTPKGSVKGKILGKRVQKIDFCLTSEQTADNEIGKRDVVQISRRNFERSLAPKNNNIETFSERIKMSWLNLTFENEAKNAGECLAFDSYQSTRLYQHFEITILVGRRDLLRSEMLTVTSHEHDN